MSRDWEATLRAWAHRASDAEDDKRKRTERAITEALNAIGDIRHLPINVYAKGSYANNTNIRLDSDVDVAVEYTGFAYYDLMFDLADESAESLGITASDDPYGPAELKNDVERALVSAFGRAAVTRNNKAITVREQTNRLSADVVPCFSYCRYSGRSAYGGLRSEKGTKLFPDRGGSIVNWPKQQLTNGTAKNDATSRRYKRMVRCLKNLENELCENGLIKEAPGYFAECLVYNVPNEYFGRSTYLADMRGVLAYLFNSTQRQEACWDFAEANDLKWLFRGTPRLTWQDAHRLVDAGWDYMGLT